MKADQKKIVEILIRRDGISKQEAEWILRDFETEAQASLEMGVSGFLGAMDVLESLTDIAREHLGLEPDYVEYLIHDLLV